MHNNLLNPTLFGQGNINDWESLMKFASRQGIYAIMWDCISQAIAEGRIPTHMQPSKREKIQWAFTSERHAAKYHHRNTLSREIADLWAKEGIKTYGLKGWAISSYYSKPELRECGDFDCYLGEHFQHGNDIAMAAGATFDPHDYRHSLIHYKGLAIENHRYFLPIRGNDRNKRLEEYLKAVIPCDRQIEGTNIYYPSAQFHALFIILHMLQHFLYEDITLRHMLDWAYFVNAEKYNVDWREFNERCEEAGATRFVESLNHICIEHLGLNIDGTPLRASHQYADKILHSTLEQSSLHASKVTGLWAQRYAKVQNIIFERWKFNEIYDVNFMHAMMQSALSALFGRV